MTSPYAALLTVRRIEEQQAEAALAETLAALTAAERAHARVHGARVAWLAEGLPGGTETVLVDTLMDLEAAEREAESRVVAARAAVSEARTLVLARQRAREVVEKLHVEFLAAEAREAARRAQRELDEFGARAVGAFTREAR